VRGDVRKADNEAVGPANEVYGKGYCDEIQLAQRRICEKDILDTLAVKTNVESTRRRMFMTVQAYRFREPAGDRT
jgi:hypothetical protein